MTGSVTFTPSKADYVAAMRVHFVKQLTSRRFMVRMGLLGLGVWLAMTLFGLMLDDELLGASTIGFLSTISGVAGLAAVILANFLLLPRRSGRLYDQQKSLHREIEFRWNDDGTEWISENGNTRCPWPEYHRWTASRDVILLYMNDNFMHFIPRHVLGAAADDLVATVSNAGVLPR